MSRPLSVWLAATFAILVVGCATDQPPPAPPTALVLNDSSILSVDATAMEVLVDQQPVPRYPYVGYRSPIAFKDALDTWAHKHFQLTGNAVGKLRVRLRHGDIVEELLPIRHGIAGWFTKDQGAEYSGELSVSVIMLDAGGRVLTTADGDSSDRRTVVEDTTDAEKQAVWAGMVKTMFDNLDKEFLPNLKRGMSAYIH